MDLDVDVDVVGRKCASIDLPSRKLTWMRKGKPFYSFYKQNI